MLTKLKTVVVRIDPHKVFHGTVNGSHLAYFGAAAVGAHEVHAIAAAVLFVVVLIGTVLHYTMEV